MSNLKRELQRAVANHKYEPTEGGVLFPQAKLAWRGMFDIAVNDEEPEYFPNLIVTEFLNSALSQLFGTTSKIGTYYIAPYAGNVSPTSSWDASNFTSNSTEFTAYDEANRQEWVVPTTASGGSIDNSASKASFTVEASPSQTTIWGAGLLSASGKSATTGVLVAANKAAAARDNLVEDDIITIGYTLTLSDAS